MKKIDIQEVEHIARLAKIEINLEEAKQYSKDLQNIVEYIHILESIDTNGVEPTFQISQNCNVMDEDEPGECLNRKSVLELAPNSDQKYIISKGVFNYE